MRTPSCLSSQPAAWPEDALSLAFPRGWLSATAGGLTDEASLAEGPHPSFPMDPFYDVSPRAPRLTVAMWGRSESPDPLRATVCVCVGGWGAPGGACPTPHPHSRPPGCLPDAFQICSLHNRLNVLFKMHIVLGYSLLKTLCGVSSAWRCRPSSLRWFITPLCGTFPGSILLDLCLKTSVSATPGHLDTPQARRCGLLHFAFPLSRMFSVPS